VEGFSARPGAGVQHPVAGLDSKERGDELGSGVLDLEEPVAKQDRGDEPGAGDLERVRQARYLLRLDALFREPLAQGLTRDFQRVGAGETRGRADRGPPVPDPSPGPVPRSRWHRGDRRGFADRAVGLRAGRRDARAGAKRFPARGPIGPGVTEFRPAQPQHEANVIRSGQQRIVPPPAHEFVDRLRYKGAIPAPPLGMLTEESLQGAIDDPALVKSAIEHFDAGVGEQAMEPHELGVDRRIRWIFVTSPRPIACARRRAVPPPFPVPCRRRGPVSGLPPPRPPTIGAKSSMVAGAGILGAGGIDGDADVDFVFVLAPLR